MAVRIRLKKLGRRHRPFYRIVAMDARQQRDGRVIEELGTYDPMARDDNVSLKASRVKHWVGVGAQPTEKVAAILKRYLAKAEEAEANPPAAPAAETAAAEAPAEGGS